LVPQYRYYPALSDKAAALTLAALKAAKARVSLPVLTLLPQKTMEQRKGPPIMTGFASMLTFVSLTKKMPTLL